MLGRSRVSSGSVLCCLCVLMAFWPSAARPRVEAIDRPPGESSSATLSGEILISPDGLTTSLVTFEPGRRLEVMYDFGSERWPDGTSPLAGATPRALASGDFDSDGVPDLAVGYASGPGGYVALYKGNVDSIYPNSPGARRRRADGIFTGAPLLGPARIFTTPRPADLLAAGDFDGDSLVDLTVAALGDEQLQFLAGDGHGGLANPRTVDLGGSITALTSGEINRKDGLEDLVIGVEGSRGAEAVIFQSSRGALAERPERVHLPTSATGFSLGQISGDGSIDLAVVSGTDLLVVHGRDRTRFELATSGPIVEPVSLEPVVRGVAVGDFLQHNAWNRDLAILDDHGAVHFFDLSEVAQGTTWTASSVLAPDGGELLRPQLDPGPATTPLVPVRVSSRHGQELAVLDGTTSALELLVPGLPVTTSTDATSLPLESILLSSSAPPVAVLPLRLNSDGIDDLVVLQEDSPAPIIILSTFANTFTVNSTGAESDCNIGNGTCGIKDLSNPSCSGTCTGACELDVCTLRAAEQEAEATAGADLIDFDIGGGGQQTISGHTSVTHLETVTIDGTTQPGFSGTPVVQVQGANSLIRITGDNSVVRGLAFRPDSGSTGGCARNGVELAGGSGQRSDNNIIEGNYFGVGFDGITTYPDTQCGVVGALIGAENLIGGTTESARNVFGGLSQKGIELAGDSAALDNRIQGNYIGVDASGTTAIAGGRYGVFVNLTTYITGSGGGTEIGGAGPGEGNVISGWTGGATSYGIWLSKDPGTPTALIRGNAVGTNAAATVALANGSYGIRLFGSGPATIGGAATGAGNVISGNTGKGIDLNGNDDKIVQGNWIGTNSAGDDLGNGEEGIFTNNTGGTIGGTGAGEANVVAFNGSAGVSLQSTGNRARGNSIHSNAGLGIDVSSAGVTANDSLPDDQWTNFPVLASVVDFGSGHRVEGTLESDASATLDLDFFTNTVCDGSGHGEGETYVGSTQVTTDGSGMAAFSIDVAGVSLEQSVVATATRANGTTSEFSACSVASCAADLVLDALTLTATEEFEASNSVTLQDVDILGGTIELIAGQRVVIDNGLQTDAGAGLVVTLDPGADCQ